VDVRRGSSNDFTVAERGLLNLTAHASKSEADSA
jgi:hypothetical protein